MPKGVLWRQHDIFRAAMGGRTYGTWELVQSYDHLVSRLLPGDEVRVMSLPPLMHGAAQWGELLLHDHGGDARVPRQHPAPSTRSTCGGPSERERVLGISVVGDAMARPVVEELERGDYDTSSLLAFGSGGATLSVGIKERLVARLPTILISDVAGASETGRADGCGLRRRLGVDGDLRPRARARSS